MHFLLSEPDENRFIFFSYFCPSESLLKANATFSKPLPKCYKTLLRTPKYLNICKLPDESMLWNKEIVRNLDLTLLNKYGNTTIDINMNGLLVTKSARLKFWPLLSRPVYTDNDPFLIGLYMGKWEPVDVHFYLHDFVVEMEYFLEHGDILNDITNIHLFLKNFISDPPVKCCVDHNGYGACEKCTVCCWRIYQ